VTVEGRPVSFVERSGTDFVVDGEPVVYSGLNAMVSSRWQGVDWVNRAMSVAAAHGVTSIRTWGFPGGYRAREVHLGPGEFDDTWLEFFDHVVVAAKRNGIRLILPVLMNWYGPDLAPSPAAYAEWSSTADGHNSFFGDETANEYWAEYVEHVLTHTNHLTGVEYRNDPTIMMWEVGNEIEYLDERRGESLAAWYDGAARHIKSLDDVHLVGSGMHGATGDVYERWNVRNAFVETHRSDAIDACSFHDYPVVPDGDGVKRRSHEAFSEYVTSHVRKAHEEVGKPAYFGEVGTKLPAGEGQPRVETRDEYFRVAVEAANASGLNGVNFWRLAWDSRDHERAPDDPRKPLIIHPDDESTWDIIERYAADATRGTLRPVDPPDARK
jgi:mannan endo-1,4-beta-mannosidase